MNRDPCEIACVINSVIIITQTKNCAPTYSQFAPQATVSVIKNVHLEETTVCVPTYYQDVAKRCDAQDFALREGFKVTPPISRDGNPPASRIIVSKSAILLNKTEAHSALSNCRKNLEQQKPRIIPHNKVAGTINARNE